MDGGARIEGLNQFVKALKVAGDQYPAAMKEANYQAASEIVSAARSRAEAYGGVLGKAGRQGMRASRAATYSAVLLGGARAPYAVGAEFGALRRTRRNRKIIGGFKPWRGNRFGGWDGGPGYFLHPAIREEGKHVIDEYMKRVDAISERAFPE